MDIKKRGKSSLVNLRENVEYYKRHLDLKKIVNSKKGEIALKKPHLIRYYFSVYEFYKKKYDNSKTDSKRVEHQKNYRNSWNLYCWMLSTARQKNEAFKNNDFYEVM